MVWVQIQTAEQATWDDYVRVVEAVGTEPPEGLIVHAATPHGATWRSVDVWESEAAYDRFRDERLMPAVQEALPAELANAGPPPSESFEAQHVIRP